MPFTVNDLIGERLNPVSVTPQATIAQTIVTLIEHDYSQLPVVDEQYCPIAMVTSDSIVRALNNFGVAPSNLRVMDAMVPITRTFSTNEDLFSLLPSLRDTYAVLVVDRDGKLSGIVTNYDTAEYFRQRSQDMMLVQEVEETIKTYVNLAFTKSSGELDEDARRAAVDDITPSNSELRSPFHKAVAALHRDNGAPKVSSKHIDGLFAQHLFRKQKVKQFDKLTLGEYIALFLHASRWNQYKQAFPLERNAIETLLKSVLDTRNDLAHFRVEITAQQREALRFCKDWLQHYEPDVNRAFAPPSPVEAEGIHILPIETIDLPGNTADEAVHANETSHGSPEEVRRYDQSLTYLTHHLQGVPSNIGKLDLPFDTIENIIGEKLPVFARTTRSFWSNDPSGRPHIQEILDMGWRIGQANMTAGTVTFVRIRERQRAYIDFYNPLLAQLRACCPFPIWDVSPDGSNWIQVASIRRSGKLIAIYGFAFTSDRRFRIDLYIDTNEPTRNKRLFDTLAAHKEEIEGGIGDTLSWERIDDARASRVALYRDAFITASASELDQLRSWAVDAMIQFQRVMEHYVAIALDAEALSGEQQTEGAR